MFSAPTINTGTLTLLLSFLKTPSVFLQAVKRVKLGNNITCYYYKILSDMKTITISLKFCTKKPKILIYKILISTAGYITDAHVIIIKTKLLSNSTKL